MSQLRLFLLGPLQVSVYDEPVAGLSSAKILALLAYLSVERRPHPRGALAELLWPDRPAGNAAQNLRQSLSRLTRALQRPTGLDFILATRQTVALNPAADVWLDVDAFTAAIVFVRAHAHRNIERCRRCCTRLEEAVALYRGDFLEELLADSPPFEEWATLQREWLHGQVLEALGHLAAHYTSSADYRASYDYARRQVELEPWLEKGHRQLMRALAGMGRRNEALAAYDSCRQTLADTLGVAPSAQTTELYEAIKHEAIMARPEAGMTDADALVRSSPPSPAPRHNLPRQFTPFIGREREQAEIHQRLDRETCALLTILGPGGAGKTRLAVEVAGQRLERYRDGVWFVPLAPVGDASLLPVTIATHLHLALSGTAEPAIQLADHLRSRHLLLVLDNVEHLHDDLDLLPDLLLAAPDVKLLVTSRTALNFRAEWLYEVAGLPFPGDPDTAGSYDAPDLFIQIARQLQQDFKPETELEAIVRICKLVEGMPLALELAAAQVPGASCRQIAGAIAGNLDYLATSMRDVPLRQRSLRAVFDSSWNLLSAEEQAVLPRLSQFAGGFASGAADAVAGATPDVLERLLDKSFLRPDENGRYQMHELLRQYAAEMLGPEAATVSARHADYYADFTARHHKLLNGAQQKQALATMSRDFNNVMAAWQWALDQADELLLGRFTDGLWAYLDDRGLYRDGLALFERALATAPEEGRAQEASAEASRVWTYLRMAAGFFHQRLGQYPQARRLYEQCLETYRRLDDLAQSAHCLYYLGGVAGNAGQLEEALDRLQECLAVYQRLESDRHVANTLTKMGSVLELMGRYDDAGQMLRQALALKRELNQPLGIANSLNNLALLLWRTGRYDEAEAFFRESLDINREIGNPGSIASNLSNLGRLLITRGDYQQAQALLQESLALEQTVQNKRHTMIALNNLGLVSHLLGEGTQVQHYLAQSLALARETGNQREEAYARLTLGRILLDEGEDAEAGHSLRRTLQLATKLRLTPLSLAALVQAARLLARRGETAQAGDVLQQPLHHPAAWHQTRVEAEALAEELEVGQPPASVPAAGELWETISGLIETL
jgi:predicted ATPase/DNA-binding SARP family transcriptional activator/Tfp pilus assembly protein PilF